MAHYELSVDSRSWYWCEGSQESEEKIHMSIQDCWNDTIGKPRIPLSTVLSDKTSWRKKVIWWLRSEGALKYDKSAPPLAAHRLYGLVVPTNFNTTNVLAYHGSVCVVDSLLVDKLNLIRGKLHSFYMIENAKFIILSFVAQLWLSLDSSSSHKTCYPQRCKHLFWLLGAPPSERSYFVRTANNRFTQQEFPSIQILFFNEIDFLNVRNPMDVRIL